MNTIQDEWTQFESNVIEATPGIWQPQIKEMKKSFYAGATGLLALIINIGDVSEEAHSAMLDGWYDECFQFAEDVKAGKA